MVLIAACYLWLGYPERNLALNLSSYVTTFTAQLAPLVLVGYITTMLSNDIRHALRHIKWLSETDSLTGVHNIRAFTVLAENIFRQAERYARPFALLMIDSDSLKGVNDKYGHEAGNRLLKLTVRCIQTQLRQSDLVARYEQSIFLCVSENPATQQQGIGTGFVIREDLGQRVQHPRAVRDRGQDRVSGHGRIESSTPGTGDSHRSSSSTASINRFPSLRMCEMYLPSYCTATWHNSTSSSLVA